MPNKKNGLPFDKIDKIFNINGSGIHFVGVNGVSMCSLAKLAKLSGARVSGSDRDLGSRTRDLVSMGAYIYPGHSAEHISEDLDLVVYSSAISEDNIELIRAKELDIPIITRSRFMGALMMAYGRKIGISGTHGKSTTTAMLDAIFTKAGKNQTTLAGEDLTDLKSPLRVGGKDYLIYEACEYKDAFQMFNPSIAIALNMEMDHVDYYKDERQLKASFAKALSKATDFVLLNEDDENLFKIKTKITSRVVTFGTNEKCDYRYSIISFSDTGHTFSVSKRGRVLGIFKLSVIGAFNVINACAAAIAAMECGISVKVIEDALREFSGIPRRLEPVGSHLGRTVIYDYAHHPTEIKASINTVRSNYQDEVTVIFKPHTYSRTEYFWRDFIFALELADYIVITDIYPARENPIPGVTSENLAKAIGSRAVYAKDSEIIEIIDLYTHGTIIVMGAGDLADVKDRLIRDENE